MLGLKLVAAAVTTVTKTETVTRKTYITSSITVTKKTKSTATATYTSTVSALETVYNTTTVYNTITSNSTISSSTCESTSTSSAPSCTSTGNLLGNAGFDSGLLCPWITFASTYNYAPLYNNISSPGFQSPYAYNVTFGSNGGSVTLQQSLPVQAGINYTMSYMYFVTANPPSSVSCVADDQYIDEVITSHVPVNTWLSSVGYFVPTAASTTLICYIIAANEGEPANIVFLLDNFSIVC